MKKSRLLFLLPIIASFALTACDLSSLMPNTPRRRSSRDEDSEIVDNKNSNNEHEHVWGDWFVVREASCVRDGEERRTCQICGNVQTKIINKTGHLWGEWVETMAATCTSSGLKERICSRCGVVENKETPALGHYFDETQWVTVVAPTCFENGVQENRCYVCGEAVKREIPATEHNWIYSSGTIEPTCTTDGYYVRTCSMCGLQQEEVVPATGHDMQLVGGNIMPQNGKAAVRLYKCLRCGISYMGFNVTDVSESSKQRLVFEQDYDGEYSASFWGRPIGNAMALDYSGASVNQLNNECVYCSTETGDYFEYVFDLTADQAVELQTCRLYCDAKPANFLNGTDFWAYGKNNTDWTPGFYIDGADEHIEKDTNGNTVMVNDHARPFKADDGSEPEGTTLDTLVPLGRRIEGYRYALYVDGQFQDFDPDIENPTHGSNQNMQREEFVLPYTFHLHQGENRISLHMAGGYRSTFYNFVFKPYVEPTPVEVNEASIEMREGQTAQITSSMTGLTYKSSSTSVCTVDQNGLVTGVKAGTATITVSKEGNYKNAKVAVTVLEKEGIVALNLTDGVIAPENGITVYNSSSSGTWYRNPKQNATLTYTFQSELAGLFDIQLGLRGSNISLPDIMAIKVNNVDVAVSGTVSTSYTAAEYVVGLADLKVGENTMVITFLADNSLYLQTLKLLPHDFNQVIRTWSCEDLETNRTESGWADSKDFGDAGKAFKFNKAGNVTVTYESESAQKVMLALKLSVKQSNRATTGFWKQSGVEKTRIIINGVALEAGDEPDFTGCVASSVNDSGTLAIPEWYNIAQIDLLPGENTITIEFLTGGYSYYLGGISLAK